MAGKMFQITVGTSRVALSTVTAIAGLKVRSGIKIITPAGNTGLLFYGNTDDCTISANSAHIPNGSPFTINPDEFVKDADGNCDLTKLWLISNAASQQVTGVLL